MIPDRYNKNNLTNVVQEPSRLIDESKRIFRGIRRFPHRTIGRRRFIKKHGNGTDVMERDWDTLFILDACRYDILSDILCTDDRFDGEIESIISKGSQSKEFCKKTFHGKQYHDTVYVTANGYGAQLGKDVFHDLIFTDTGKDTVIHGKDQRHPSWEGISPQTLYDTAIDTYKKHPNKRIIVHFMQPHSPYFGTKAEQLRDRLRDENILITQKKQEFDDAKCKFDDHCKDLMNAARKGYVTTEELTEAYINCLEYVLDYVFSLASEIDGKHVITADHGELLGERIGPINNRLGVGLIPYNVGHSPGLYVEELRKVPWMVFESDARRSITSEEPIHQMRVCEEDINQRLKLLGYKE